jgi:hypothetical protein
MCRSKEPSRFEAFLAGNSIRYIPSRRNNPQTTGKLEGLWLEYDDIISGSILWRSS